MSCFVAWCECTLHKCIFRRDLALESLTFSPDEVPLPLPPYRGTTPRYLLVSCALKADLVQSRCLSNIAFNTFTTLPTYHMYSGACWYHCDATMSNAAYDLNSSFDQVSWTQEEVFDEASPVLFCDFLKPGADKRLYEESRDMTKMQQVCSSFVLCIHHAYSSCFRPSSKSTN